VTGADFTAEEVTALRDAAFEKEPGSRQGVCLAVSDRQARKQLPKVEKCMAVVKERLRKRFTHTLRSSSKVDAQPVQLAGPMVMQSEMRTYLMGALICRPSGEVLAAVGVSARLGFHLIELAYGAPNVPAKVLPARDRLTLVERETLWPYLLNIAKDFCEAVGLGEPPQIRIEPTGYPTELGALFTDESGVVQQMSIALGEYPAQLGFILTPKALDALGSSQDDAHQAEALTAAADAMLAHVGSAQVTVVANLGTATVLVRDLVALATDTVIWLDKTPRDPLEVLVEGQPKFQAMPMQRAGAVGVQIVSRTP
jgi:flagellar motor switch protein FliM